MKKIKTYSRGRKLIPPAALLTLLCAMLSLAGARASAHGQQGDHRATGVVTDRAGTPLGGVTVRENDTFNATATNSAGEFVLQVSKPETSLTFTFIGYGTVSMRAAAGMPVRVVMEEGDIVIDEIVKVAYGTQKRESITGAISSIGSGDILKSSSANITTAIAGRIAGLTALQGSGAQPGYDNAVFYLRGIGTTDASRSTPLIMIDGVPRDNFSNLDPNEVETISVLKDASATAVFGVRGANGVVLITTKRGQVGKPRLTVSFNQAWTAFTKRPARLRSLEYLDLRTQAIENSGVAEGFDAAYVDMFKNPLQGLDPTAPDYASQVEKRLYMYPDHDPYSELIRKWTPQTRLNANLSGGLDKLTYFVNVGYVHQGSNLYTEPKSKLGYDPEMKLDRWSFRTNLDYKITPTLKAYLNVATYIESVNMPYISPLFPSRQAYIQEILGSISKRLPITPGYVTIPGYGVEADRIVKEHYLDWAPYMNINRMGFRQDNNTNVNSTLGVEWDLGRLITPGLSVKGVVSYDNYAGTILNGAKVSDGYNVTVDTARDILQFSAEPKYNETELSLSRTHSTRYSINAQLSLNYVRSFGDHNLSGLVLAQRDYWESAGAALPYNVIGIVGRVTYDYRSRYFGEFNMGYNGSEQFAPGNRFGFFPAFSLGWIPTNEEFYKHNKILNYLKIRGSWGQVGNDKIGSDRFLYLDDITVGDGPQGSNPLNLGKGQYVTPSYYGNTGLMWEVATKLNGGVDFLLFESLRGTVDVFSEKRRKILITRQSVPYFQGVPQGSIPRVNMGEVDNRGYEIELSYGRLFAGELFVNLRGNLSYSSNKVVFYDEIRRDDTYSMPYARTGYAVDQMSGYLIDWKSNGGYWTSQDEIDQSGLSYSFGIPQPGDFRYVDVNRDGVIDDKDIVPIGYSGSIPKYNYGFGLDASWKGLDFSVFFQGVAKYSSYYGANVMEYMTEGTYWEYTRRPWTESRWQAGEKITYPRLSTSKNTNHEPNSFFIFDRSFLRLKNIELGYTFPRKWLDFARIESFRVYVSGQNLLVWDKIRAGHIDPEMNSAIDYPVTRMISFGCNINF